MWFDRPLVRGIATALLVAGVTAFVVDTVEKLSATAGCESEGIH
jgi:hypothetical protein